MFVSTTPLKLQRVLLSLFLICFLTACSSLSGFPAASINENAELEDLQPYFKPATVDACIDDANCRNKIVNGRLRAVDLNYYAFVKALFVQHNSASLAADIAVLGLNAAGAVAGGALTKAALAAASAGIVGVKGAVDADLFYQKTMPALVAQMDAQRKTILAQILRGLTEGVSQYPLQQALRDVDSYYAAGTIPGAITGIVGDAGAKTAEADNEIIQISGPLADDVYARQVKAHDWIRSLTNEQDLDKVIRALNLSLPANSTAGQKRNAIFRELDKASTNPALDALLARVRTQFPAVEF
jgi:hypothetical protein